MKVTEYNLNELLLSSTKQNQEVMAIIITKSGDKKKMSTTQATPQMRNLNDYLMTHRNKIQNATLVDLSGFVNVPAGKHMLFKTNDEQDASLIMFDDPNQMWVDDAEPSSIKVEPSGIVIENTSSRIYAGKSNLTKFTKDAAGKIVGMFIINKAKTSAEAKPEAESVTSSETDPESTKLHIKRISPRLYNMVKDLSDRAAIKAKVLEFMCKTKDINHLIKIDKELLLTCKL